MTFILTVDKFANMPHLCFQIMIAGFWPHLDLFDLKCGLLLFGFLLFFGLLVLKPTIIHNLAYWRFALGEISTRSRPKSFALANA